MPTRSGRNFSLLDSAEVPQNEPGDAEVPSEQVSNIQNDNDEEPLGRGDEENNGGDMQGNLPRQVTLATFNCRGLSDGAVAEIIDFCAEKSAVILAVQDIGGNRQEPAAARLMANEELLQASGLRVWAGGNPDSNVALIHSAGLTQEVQYHDSLHTHVVAMQVGAKHTVCSVYMRPAGSQAPVESLLTTDDIDLACGQDSIILGDLNAEVSMVDGRATAQRRDARSRHIARWMHARGLKSAGSAPTWRNTTRSSTIDHIICNESTVLQAAECRWTEHSDHALLHANTFLPVQAADNPAHARTGQFILPAYGHARWHEYGSLLSARMKQLSSSLPAATNCTDTLQSIADKLHKMIADTAKECFERRKNNQHKRIHLPWTIKKAKRALRQHMRRKNNVPSSARAAFEETAKHLKSALSAAIRKRRAANSLSFAQKNAKMLNTLASRQAWAQVKRTMGRGQRKHSALQQHEFIKADGTIAENCKDHIHSHLLQILQKPPLPAASEKAVQRLKEVVQAPDLQPTYGEGAPSDKARPAGETEYPRTPWQRHTWGDERAGEEGQNRFSAQFVKDAVRQLATQSGGGDDGIVAELLRWVDSHFMAIKRKQVPEGSPVYDLDAEQNRQLHWPTIMSAIADCFNLFAASSFIPAQWKRSQTLLVHKKGPTNIVGNYRPIAAGNTLGKLFSHCILHGLEGWATQNQILSTLQRGFRSHRGCEDCILALTCILRAHKSVGPHNDELGTTHLCFVDFAGAYDSVDHSRLLSKLEHIGVRGPVLEIIKNTLQGQSTKGRTVDGDTPEIQVTRGLPQGHVLSPMLFSLFVNDLLLQLQQADIRRPTGTDLARTPALAYADDIVLIDRTLVGLQRKLDVVRQWSEDWGMEVNLKKGKTEHMVMGGQRKDNFTLRFGPELVRRTKSYKYLGVMLDCEDTQLNMLTQRQKTLRAAYGAHNAVKQLHVASPDMPLGTISSIWQTWVLPQLCYGVGVWGQSSTTQIMETFMYRCGRVLMGAKYQVPKAIVQAEMGWRSIRFWVRYHQCRTLSRLLRAPKGDLLHTVLLDQLASLESGSQGSWLRPILEELSTSNFKQAAQLRTWIQNTLPVLNPARMDEAIQQLNAMGFEDAWAGTVLHDEHAEWQREVYRGPARSHFAVHVSERRDRGADLDVKPRWATIMRPSRALRHLVGRADSKLLSETRMGSHRSLSSRFNQNKEHLGTACPCCGQDSDTASHMLQCKAIMDDLRVEEAYENFSKAMEGRLMEGRGEETDILNLGKLVQWMQRFPAGGGSHKVLLGNCSLLSVPERMRHAYLKMQIDPRTHNLWLQCCVGVIRAAWAAHDAAIQDKLAVIGVAQAPQPPGMNSSHGSAPLRLPQSEVRQMVSSFCAIVPNRQDGQADQPAGHRNEDTQQGAVSPPILGGMGDLAAWGTNSEHRGPPAAGVASSSNTRSAGRGMSADPRETMTLMGITPTEVAGLQAEEEPDVVDREMGVDSQVLWEHCDGCDDYNEDCYECREARMHEAKDQRQEAERRAERRHKFAQMVKDRMQCGCEECGSFDESCTCCDLQRENFIKGHGEHTGQPGSCQAPRGFRGWMRFGY